MDFYGIFDWRQFRKNYTRCNSVSSAGRVYIGKHQAAADVVHVNFSQK